MTLTTRPTAPGIAVSEVMVVVADLWLMKDGRERGRGRGITFYPKFPNASNNNEWFIDMKRETVNPVL